MTFLATKGYSHGFLETIQANRSKVVDVLRANAAVLFPDFEFTEWSTPIFGINGTEVVVDFALVAKDFSFVHFGVVGSFGDVNDLDEQALALQSAANLYLAKAISTVNGHVSANTLKVAFRDGRFGLLAITHDPNAPTLLQSYRVFVVKPYSSGVGTGGVIAQGTLVAERRLICEVQRKAATPNILEVVRVHEKDIVDDLPAKFGVTVQGMQSEAQNVGTFLVFIPDPPADTERFRLERDLLDTYHLVPLGGE